MIKFYVSTRLGRTVMVVTMCRRRFRASYCCYDVQRIAVAVLMAIGAELREDNPALLNTTPRPAHGLSTGFI